MSVWNQQRYLLDQENVPTDPINLFDQDLRKFAKDCLEAGEKIVLGIDANTDTRTGNFPEMLRSIGLLNIFQHKFGNDIPATYARGSLPIDGIFVSPALLDSHAGFLPILCDHRILWIDVPVQVALGRSMAKLPIMKPQRLILQDPRIVQRYITILEGLLEIKEVDAKLDEVQKLFQEDNSHEAIRQFNLIDDIRTQSILIADRKCRKLKMGQVPFSPALLNSWKKIKAWRLIIRKCEGKKIDSRYLKRTLKAADIGDQSLITISEAKENLQTSLTTYRYLKKDAYAARSTWLEEVATARAEEGNISAAQEMRNLVTRERQRNDARQIRFALAENTRRGLGSIEVQRSDGSWQELTEQHDIETALLEELEKRFNQASQTPFCTEPLLSDIGPLGTGKGSAQILAGLYTPQSVIDPWTSRLLPYLQQAIPTDPVYDISEDEYRYSWSKVKERTSAGPSGITIPHMKAHCTSSKLLKIDTRMANLPFRYGFALNRWKKGLDVMLEKKPGVRQISTLRAILLYEADFNQNNKRLGRDMLRRAEKFGCVALEQYGSRKNLSAVDQSLNKILTFDLWRQFRQNGALCSNDAKSCYDRIVHNCATLCMKRIGTPQAPIVSMFATIQELSHHVRTIYGESVKGFSQNGSVPIQGVGQGNGAGPQIWALVSTPVLNMLRDKGLGAEFRSAISDNEAALVGYAFVDDTDLVASKPNITPATVLSAMQDSLTAWEGGIRSTGGGNRPRKITLVPYQFWVEKRATLLQNM